jgi:hypothetical protein
MQEGLTAKPSSCSNITRSTKLASYPVRFGSNKGDSGVAVCSVAAAAVAAAAAAVVGMALVPVVVTMVGLGGAAALVWVPPVGSAVVEASVVWRRVVSTRAVVMAAAVVVAIRAAPCVLRASLLTVVLGTAAALFGSPLVETARPVT